MIKIQNYICVVLISNLLFYSCTFTYKKTETTDVDIYYGKINTYGERYRSYITLMSGEEYRVESLLVQKDSTFYYNVDSNQIFKIQTTEIKYIEFRDIVTGAVGGFLVGLFGGLLVGVATYYIGTGGETSGEDMSGLVIIAGPLLVGPIGLIIGAIKQDRKIYYINNIQ